METVEDLVRAARAAGVAEVCWTTPDGTPQATAVVPLTHEGLPALALHPHQWASARELAACPQVALVLSDRRLAQRDWEPGAGHGRCRLVVDADGSVFREELLTQELRKHPPSRAYADSSILRKENWWFLPRLLLVWEPTRVHPVAERTDPEAHGVLVVAAADGALAVDTVDRSGRSLGDRPAPPPGPAVLLLHDFSAPDLERWGRVPVAGRWDGAALRDARLPTAPVLPGAPGLLERLRRHRDLERQCVRALRDMAV